MYQKIGSAIAYKHVSHRDTTMARIISKSVITYIWYKEWLYQNVIQHTYAGTTTICDQKSNQFISIYEHFDFEHWLKIEVGLEIVQPNAQLMKFLFDPLLIKEKLGIFGMKFCITYCYLKVHGPD